MNQRIKRGWRLAMLMACASAFGQSNPIEGGTTETVTNVWNVLLPWLIVGGNSAGNALIVTDGGQVNNAIGYIGHAVTSTDNSVLVTGDGSEWNNSMELSVGYQGAGNALTVADGGTVTAPDTYVGNNSDSNRVTVTGSNSLLDAAMLYVGYQGEDNRLLLTDSGTVQSDTGTIGYWINSDGNIATVQSNGTWNSSTELNIGGYGSDNQLVIGAGGLVESLVVNVGVQSISFNNTVTVTGDDAWLDAPELYIGGSAAGAGGIGNRVEVENGGTVYTESLNIYDGNAFDLHNSGRLFVNTNFNASMDHFSWNTGGTLEVGGELTGLGGDLEGERTLIMNGTNAIWSEGGFSKMIGWHTSNNLLVITNGAAVYGSSSYVSFGGDAHSNSVIVGGKGSIWTNDGNIYLGYGGGNNSLIVTDGGRVYNELGAIGRDEGHNTALMTGLNSLWVNDELSVGDGSGNNNTLMITDGGRVESVTGIIGRTGVSDSNTVFVTGNDSIWQIRSNLYVGGAGSNNHLEISSGGRVENLNGIAGIAPGGNNNSILVTGGGSVWQNYKGLYLGGHYEGANWVDGGTGNSLTVEDGGWVLIGDVDTNALSNSGITEGHEGIAIGDSSGKVEMIVANGSLVDSVGGWIGLGVGESGSVIVTGSNSVWMSSATVVGYDGANNSLTIEKGGRVETGTAIIGHSQGSDDNNISVMGSGSVWNSSETFYIGYQGAGNSLQVADGGSVTTRTTYVGYYSDDNQVTVTGNGSVWSNALSFSVGFRGMGNSLIIEERGRVNSGGGTIGYTFGSDNNSVLITGMGSIWNNSDDVSVGNYGTGNSLIIENGGRLDAGNGQIGLNRGSDNNSVLVTGAGSVWNNSGDLCVGLEGAGNSLTIGESGRVENLNGYIGYWGSANSNSVMVTGSGSVWQNYEGLYLGGHYEGTHWLDGGIDNSLYVADGGLVSVGAAMYNRNYSIVNLDPGGLITIGGDYYQDASSMLRFGVETNAAGAPVNALITVGGTAEFEEGAQIEYASNVGEMLFDRFYTNKLIEADALVVAGITNANSLDLERLDASGSLVDVIFWENDQNIYVLAGRKYLADSAGFAQGTMMARLSKEIDDMSLLGNADAMRMIDLLNTLSGSEQHNELLHQYAYTTPGYLHIQGMTEGLDELAKHVSRRLAPAPEGAAGPYSADRGARGWIRPYGQWSDRSDQDGFSGCDHNVYGTLVGIDWMQDNVLLGVAGGYARSDIDQDDGSDSQADTGYGVFYASVGTKDWFGDVSVAFGRSDIEDDSGTVFGADADYEANNFALYMGGGKEMRSRSGMFSFTPQASLLLSQYQQNSYTEEMGTGVAREVEAYDHSSVVSSLGAAVAMQQEYDGLTLRPEVRLRWLHEFNDDEEKLDFTLSDGMGGQYFSLMPGAEENILEAGAGLSCGFDNAWTLMLDLDWRFGEDYDAYSVSGRAVYEF